MEMDVPDAASASGRKTMSQGEKPELWSFPAHVSRELAVLVEPGSIAANSMLSIASRIQHMHVDQRVRSFCFIADEHRRGTTVVSANVAAAFAASGLRTILVETNFRSPRMTAMFSLDGKRPGLSEWLAGIEDMHSLSAHIQPVWTNLLVMPAGVAVREGEPYLATELRPLVLEMSRMFDVVICDAPPMTDISGTLAVVSAVERTILVARANHTALNRLIAFQDTVQECGGVLGGSVYLDY